jgi:hypothetical protein
MSNMPHELVLGEIYVPPLLIVIMIAYLLTSLVSTISAKLGVGKYVAIPAIAELSLLIILASIISRFIAVI